MGNWQIERLLRTVTVKEKGNYLMPFFSSIKVSAYANYLAEASTGRGRTTIIFLRKDLSFVIGATWRRRWGGRGVREAK